MFFPKKIYHFNFSDTSSYLTYHLLCEILKDHELFLNSKLVEQIQDINLALIEGHAILIGSHIIIF